MKAGKLFKFSVVIILLVLIVAICSVAGLTFARYRTGSSGEVEPSIAKWSFKVNGAEDTFADIEIVSTLDTSDVMEKKLAPGTYGDFTIEIDGRGSEVSLMYFITISDFVDKPTNLIFYADEECTKEYELQEDGSLRTAGKILLDDIDAVKYEKVYWRWEYTTGTTDEEVKANNIIDTEEAGLNTTAKITVKGIQMNEDSEEIVDGKKVYYKENSEIVIPFKVRTADYETSSMYMVAATGDVSLNNTDPLNLREDNIEVRVDGEVVIPRTKKLKYKASRNGIANYELTVSGIKENGKIDIIVRKNKLDKTFTTTSYVDATIPEMKVSPNSAEIGEDMDISLIVSDNNFSDENVYEYYISNSGVALEGGEWVTYKDEAKFTIKNNGYADRYVWVKTLKDLAGNESSFTTILNGEKYFVTGPYKFDVIKPVIQPGGDMRVVSEEENGTIYEIPFEIIEEGGYEETENPSNLKLEEVQIYLDGKVFNPIEKSLKYEYTSENKHMYTLRIKLRTWGKLELKFAEDVIVDKFGLKNEAFEFEVIDIYAEMEGEGTEDNPYIIKTVKHLKQINEKPDLCYKLGRNLDLIGEDEWEIIGSESKPFSGMFDGDGYTISNIKVNNENKFSGLFGYSTGKIKNLNIKNPQITGKDYVGGLVGFSKGEINNVTVNGGYISGVNYVGGLAGSAYKVTNCMSSVSVNGQDYVGGLIGTTSDIVSKSYAISNVSGRSNIGGLIGQNNSSIYECYATGMVEGSSQNIGGLVGYQNGHVENTFATGKVSGEYRYIGALIGYKHSSLRYSYAIGEVVGETNAGGLIGYNSAGEITNSYWLVETTKKETSSGGTRLSVIRSMKKNAYTDWDFRDIWTIEEDVTMPYLNNMVKPDSVNVNNIEGAVFFESGDGSINNPYIIVNKEQLKAISNNLTSNFKLGANIDLNENELWQPIGNTTYYFSGSLDGDGYTISYLNVDTIESYAGLFGYTNATIKNLKLLNPKVKGKDYVGSLAGRTLGEISNIEVINPEITGESNNIGGLIGYSDNTVINSKTKYGSVTGVGFTGGLIGQSITTIKNCYSTTDVIGSGEYTGGLIGYSRNVELSYSTGNVTSTSNYVGGLVGRSDNVISKSYATGNVQGVSYIGGISGYNYSVLENCFATGNVNSVNGNYVASLTGYNNSTINNSYAIGKVEGNIATYKGGLSNYGTGFNNSYWLPETTGQATSSAGTRGSLTRLLKKTGYYNWDFDVIWKIDESESMAYIRDLPKPDSVKRENIKGSIFFEGGTGTLRDPYIIVNEEQLKAVNNNLSSYFKLGRSITLTNTESWIPLGSETYKFTGGLDGDGYTISNVYIDSTQNDIGLFGYSTGTLKNIKLSNINVTGKDYVGALVGRSYGRINNIEVSNSTVKGTASNIGGVIGYSNGNVDSCKMIGGTVTGVSYVGGLIGTNIQTLTNSNSTANVTGTGERVGGLVGHAEGNLTKCYATGNVYSDGNCVGGLIGYRNGSTLSESYATGNTESKSGYVGGLIGYSQHATTLKSYATGNVLSTGDYAGGLIGNLYSNSVENCFATGNVEGKSSFVGGLIGRKNSTVINCYAIGNVKGAASYVGGLIGHNDNGSEHATNSYWTPETTNLETSSAGYRGLIEAMIHKYAYLNWNFTGIWKIDEGTSFAYLLDLPKPNSVNFSSISSYIQFEQGDGSELNPFIIYTKEQLRAMNYGMSSYYKLGNNIELPEDYVWTPIGDTYNKFIGGLDGNGFKISNINVESTVNYQGFFGYADAKIKNVTLENVTVKGGTYVGGLAGYSKGRIEDVQIINLLVEGTGEYVGGMFGSSEGLLQRCSVNEGTVKGSSNFVGGLAGREYSSTENCNANIEVIDGVTYVGGLIGYADSYIVNSYSSGSVTARGDRVGGLVGQAQVTVEKCYSSSNVNNGANYVGGLCGYSTSNTENCFATGNTKGGQYVGALLGHKNAGITNSYAIGKVSANNTYTGGLYYSGNSSSVVNSYWCPETTRQETSTGGTSSNINNLKKKSSYYKWNFYDIWKIDEGTSLAYLKNLPKPDDVLLSKIDTTKFFTNGDGSCEDPYIITTAEQLSWMRYNMNAHYKLGCSFSASGYEWKTIGSSSNYFKGELDGAGYTISGLKVGSTDLSYQGIFAYSSGNIHDIKFSGCSVEALDYSGIVAGYSNGTIENVEISGSTISARNYIGLLVGQSAGTIKKVTISGGSCTGTSYVGGLAGTGSAEGISVNNITITGVSYLGGILGSGTLSYSNSNATVNGTEDYVGCLVGSSGGINYSYATGNVIGRSSVGGLIGSGNASYCYATGNATGTGNNVGGLIGYGNTSYCYASGRASGVNFVGGLIGYSNNNYGYGSATYCYALGSASGSSYIGGLCGYMDRGTTSYTYNVTSVSGNSSVSNFVAGGSVYWGTANFYPGLKDSNNNYYNMTSKDTYVNAGWDFNTIWEMSTYPILRRDLFRIEKNMYGEQYIISNATEFNEIRNNSGYAYKLTADIDLNDLEEPWVPFDFSGYLDGAGYKIKNLNLTVTSGRTGLFGYNNGTIKNLGIVNSTATGVGEVGILVGRNDGTIENCYAQGTVNGTDNNVGVLVGHNYTGTIKKCYSVGSTTGSANNIGGLIGYNESGKVENCFSTASVQGNVSVGGLLGADTNGTVLNTYAIGSVVGKPSIGGLVGHISSSNVTNSYYVPELNKQENGNLGRSVQVTQMLKKETFKSWDFGRIWNMDINRSMPYLRGMDIPTQVYESNIEYDRSLAGEGTLENPYKIGTATEFNQIRYSPSSYYELVDNIDLSELEEPWVSFCPNEGFTGKLDGKGFTVSNFTYSSTDNYRGLFGRNSGEICNLNIDKINITGASYVGGLVGYSDGYIHNVTITNLTMSVKGYSGGLVGQNAGTIENCEVNGTITGSEAHIGVLVGYNNSAKTIINCNTSGVVENTNNTSTGGLVGRNDGIIKDSYSTAKAIGKTHTAGLVGYSYGGEITRCYATGDVEGVGDSIGGLIGDSSSTVTECCATGNVKGSGSNIGGLIGYSTGYLNNSFALGNVEGGEFVGALTGRHQGSSITNTYAIGTVSKNTTEARTYIGGLNGYTYNGNNITNSYYVPETTGQINNSSGGIRITYQRLLNKENYNNWDFDNIWTIKSGTPAYLKNVNVIGIDGIFGKHTSNVNYYTEGDGTKSNPYKISTPEQLQNINSGLDKYYEIVSDINLSKYNNWMPIGDNIFTFKGYINGNGHVISNLNINRPTIAYQGLFGYSEGTITNLKLVGVNVEGQAFTGGLVGYSKGKISDIEVKEGTIIGNGERVGGLIGNQVGGEIKSCSTNVLVKSISHRLGGLAGEFSESTVENCYAFGDVQGTYEYNGGLVGVATNGTINNSYATGNVSGRTYTGGFAGHLNTSANMCYATGNVTSTGNNAGGFAGEYYNKESNKCYATGNVTASGNSVGGFIGYKASGTINNTFATGNAQGNEYVGGLIGYHNSGTINNSYAIGEVSKTTTEVRSYIGGLTGTGGSANNSYFTPETAGVIYTGGGERRSYESMFLKLKYKTWNFEDIWDIEEGTTLAYIQELPIPDSILISNINNYTTFDYGTGTIDNPYIISTPEQFELINYDLSSYYQLNNNINLSEYDNWIPIGDNIQKFKGVLDGKGFTIRNLTVDRLGTSYQGLFGYSEGKILNLKISNISVKGGAYTGGLVGQSLGSVSGVEIRTGSIEGNGENVGGLIGRQENGEIIKCNSDVSITSTTHRIGGLIGECVNTNIDNCWASGNVQGTYEYNGGLMGAATNGIINNSYATGNVSGRSHTGGFAGHLNTSANMCYATGNVTSTGNNAGGFAGEYYNTESNKCYATGNVTASGNSVGGFIGYKASGTINNTFATGNAQGNEYVGGLIGNHGGAINNSYAIGEVSKNTTEARSYIGGLTGNGGGATNSYYTPATTLQIASSAGERATLISMMQEYQYRKWDFYNIWKIDEYNTLAYIQGLPIPDSIKLNSFKDKLEYDVGNGTRNNPFKISTVNELVSVNYDLDKYYELGNSITLPEDMEWIPIGEYSSRPFAGHFDGKGYTINNINVNGSGIDYKGMFAYSIGEISNLKLNNVTVTGQSFVGGLIGRNAGTIYNVGITGAQISGSGSYLGGLIGYSDAVGKVEMCYSTGNVGNSTSSGRLVGGLIGESLSVVSKCYSTAKVQGTEYIGGLMGTKYNNLLSDAFATGTVIASGNNVGGLIGNNFSGEIHYCYSTGRVTSTGSNVGGLVGSSYDFTCNDCFWATDTSGQSVSVKGVAKSKAQLKYKATFENWKLISVWDIEEGRTTPYLRNMPVPDEVY